MKPADKRPLKALAHHLKPVIWLGVKKITPALLQETDIALNTHELIKVKIQGLEKEERLETVQTLCESLQAQCIQCLGNIAVIYRKKSS